MTLDEKRLAFELFRHGLAVGRKLAAPGQGPSDWDLEQLADKAFQMGEQRGRRLRVERPKGKARR
jgi:hypothetical protein